MVRLNDTSLPNCVNGTEPKPETVLKEYTFGSSYTDVVHPDAVQKTRDPKLRCRPAEENVTRPICWVMVPPSAVPPMPLHKLIDASLDRSWMSRQLCVPEGWTSRRKS